MYPLPLKQGHKVETFSSKLSNVPGPQTDSVISIVSTVFMSVSCIVVSYSMFWKRSDSIEIILVSGSVKRLDSGDAVSIPGSLNIFSNTSKAISGVFIVDSPVLKSMFKVGAASSISLVIIISLIKVQSESYRQENSGLLRPSKSRFRDLEAELLCIGGIVG